MAGHSKWSQIKRKKAITDQKRGKLFTKLLREIQVSAQIGGMSPEGNFRLKAAITAAKECSVPNDNIERAIKKGGGQGGSDNYEEVTYEGYGPFGVAVLIKCLTDNKTRTVSEVRTKLNKGGGSLSTANSVSYLFEERGYVVVSKKSSDGKVSFSEEKVFEVCLEAGATEINEEDDVWVVTSPPKQVETLKAEITKALGSSTVILDSKVSFEPISALSLDGEKLEKIQELVENLEDLDDVQSVYTNV